MRIILSRKGFDSSYNKKRGFEPGNGRIPSLILPDNSLLSLPIPYEKSKQKFKDLPCSIKKDSKLIYSNLYDLLQDLKDSIYTKDNRDIYCAHLDPDIRRDSLTARGNWKPAFGQHGSAMSHLKKEGVAEGDIFLFFGYFQRTEWGDDNKLKYSKEKPIHLIYGYLSIDKIFPVSEGVPDEYKYHPHFIDNEEYKKHNTIFASGTNSPIGKELPGAGAFAKYHKDLVLTKEDFSRSFWNLPKWFYHSDLKKRLSYHRNPGKPKRWIIDNNFPNYIQLESVSIGQELVLDCENYKESELKVKEWLINILDREIVR